MNRQTEAAHRVNFNILRYAQVWEDADILLEALEIKPGDHCLSVCSAGDNALCMLIADPASVTAVDINPAQIAACELRIAAFKVLNHQEMLELVGARPAEDRHELYMKCREELGGFSRDFWDEQITRSPYGIGWCGKFENYFKIFREHVLPWIHSPETIAQIMLHKDRAKRLEFYKKKWDNWRWRTCFKVFFSRQVMGWLGRDPGFFKYVEVDVASHILKRAEHALTELSTHDNPYLHGIIHGTYGDYLPLYLREEHFDTIKSRIGRIRLIQGSVEDVLEKKEKRWRRYNLSDIFEYMSLENYLDVLKKLIDLSPRGSRIVYWNMLAPRSVPPALHDRLKPMHEISNGLFSKDKAFFYSRFNVEEIT